MKLIINSTGVTVRGGSMPELMQALKQACVPESDRHTARKIEYHMGLKPTK